MKPRGAGSITPLRGRHWVRGPRQPDGSRPSLGVYDTEAEAEAVLAHAVYELSQGAAKDGSATFAAYARRVLDLREEDGVRSVASERNRFSKHLETSSIADLPLSQIRPGEIVQLLRELGRKDADDRRAVRKLARETIKRCLTLTSVIFASALVDGLVTSNPCTGVRVRTKGHAEGTKERWSYLTPEEQDTLRASVDIPRAERCMIRFAMGTGLRQGEQWNLELRDLHVAPTEPRPRVIVRFGSKGRPPKSGKIRTVPLFGDALAAAREWLSEVLPTYAPSNPEGLVFPGPTGARRRPGKLGTSARFGELLRAAGVTKHVRWHDLRHTCASSLVAGWWGRVWTLAEVRDLLGHSSVTVTEMYAHLAPGALHDAGKGTGGAPESGYGVVTEDTDRSRIEGESPEPPSRLELETYGLRNARTPEEVRTFSTAGNPSVTHAARFLELVRAGKGADALAVGVTLAESVLLRNVEATGEEEKTGS